jgi:hypothetical protein
LVQSITLDMAEKEAMRQCQGIIDVVNTTIQIALEYGYVGLALLSVMVCIMLVTTTVNSVSPIPITYWTMAAMCVAYVSIVKKALENVHTNPAS